MLHVRIDSKQVNSILGNAVKYSYGFLDGIDMEQIAFNQRLADFTIDALNKYVDSQARMNPEALHHVYEWGQVGSPSGRLFSINGKVSKRVIHFRGKFLPSKSTSDGSDEAFTNKATIMENGIGLTIEPRDGNVLVFEDGDETVFTASAVYVAHPGGDEVAGSFGRVVEEFFDVYFTSSLLKPFIDDLAYPVEYAKSFPAGTRGGRGVGVSAGKKYLRSAGGTTL